MASSLTSGASTYRSRTPWATDEGTRPTSSKPASGTVMSKSPLVSHLPPRFDALGYQLKRGRGYGLAVKRSSSFNNVANTRVEPASWKAAPDQQYLTRTAFLEARKKSSLPHISYDLDNDGAVSNLQCAPRHRHVARNRLPLTHHLPSPPCVASYRGRLGKAICSGPFVLTRTEAGCWIGR
jgi:hypothetical protein